jgi:hypothetical protein
MELTTHSQEEDETTHDSWDHHQHDQPAQNTTKTSKGLLVARKQQNGLKSESKNRTNNKHTQRELTTHSQEDNGTIHYNWDHHEHHQPAKNEQQTGTSLLVARKQQNEPTCRFQTSRQCKQNEHRQAGLTPNAKEGGDTTQHQQGLHANHERAPRKQKPAMCKETREVRSTRAHTNKMCRQQQHTHNENTQQVPHAHCQSPTSVIHHTQCAHTAQDKNREMKAQNRNKRTPSETRGTHRTRNKRNKHTQNTPPRHTHPSSHPNQRDRTEHTQTAWMTGHIQPTLSVCENSTHQICFSAQIDQSKASTVTILPIHFGHPKIIPANQNHEK